LQHEPQGWRIAESCHTPRAAMRIIKWKFILLLLVGLPGRAYAEAPPVLLSQWGVQGLDPAQIEYPNRIRFTPRGTVLVVNSDEIDPRIQEFTPDGHFIRLVGSGGVGPGQFADALGLAVATDGSLFVADYGSGRIEHFDSAGNFLT